jgi:hypothetical protein
MVLRYVIKNWLQNLEKKKNSDCLLNKEMTPIPITINTSFEFLLSQRMFRIEYREKNKFFEAISCFFAGLKYDEF